LAERAAELALDHARLTWDAPLLPEGERDPWVLLCFRLYRLRDALQEGRPIEGSVALASAGEEGPRVGLSCLDPAPWLAPQLARFGGLVGASATLRPLTVYRDLLGLPATTRLASLPSPFPPEHRLVVRATRVSTALRDRPAHAARTAQLLEEIIAAVPGNVAVYFSSFAMLEDLAGRLALPGREVLRQTPRLSAEERARWLARLGGGGAPVVLAAVLGGIFAEGVDLPAGTLRAVLVVGPGLPPVGLERELLKARYEERFGRGFSLAFWVPGLTRVTQAAGRLLRRPEDRGVIVLIDRRFRWRDVAALLPEDWAIEDPIDPAGAVRAFFAQEEPR
jgi:Rad3-related DNA helicase